jgi:hypothetical protein
MNRFQTTMSLTGRRAVMLGAFVSLIALPGVARAAEKASDRPMLTARVSRWMGDPVKKMKGPEGFDVQFRLVGPRFDGTFTVEGLPQSVPEGEAFDVQLRLTNIGGKDIKVTGVLVTGEGMVLNTEVLEKNVDPKTVATVANFRVPPQSSAGSSFLITVVMSNGDKHSATLSFSRAK